MVGEQLTAAASAGLGHKVDITTTTTIDAGAELVRRGEVIAVVAATSPTSLRLEYASAKGLSESGAARQLVAGLASHAGLTVEESDIVPLVGYDARGLSAFYVVFGVTLASFILAQLLTGAAAAVRLHHRFTVMAGFAVAIGLIGATIAGPLYGSLTPSFPTLALTLILLSASISFATKALAVWLGPPGISVAVLVFTIVGNATGGASIGYDLLPGWAQAVSAKLPQGAAVRAINDYGYFDKSHAWPSLAVLVIWFSLGLGLALLREPLANRRAQRVVPASPQATAA